MRKSEGLYGRITVLFLVVGALMAAAYFSGWLTMAKNIVVLGVRGTTVVNLTKRRPFNPPSGEGVSETRLRAYISVCRRIKPFGDKVDAWEAERAETAPKGKPAFKGAAAGLVGDYLRAYDSALEAERMGPEEFAWIDRRMKRAATEASAADAAAGSDRALYEKYRSALQALALGPHARQIAIGFAE